MGKVTLVIMAAGLGQRFGQGIKQLTSFGPSGEIIMDYSVHDALEAGFEKIVFVIRRSMLEDFREVIGDRVSRKVETQYVFQELEDLPEGFSKPEGRSKPWGTGQAILACKDVIDGPFAVINADDYYGKSAFRKVLGFLRQAQGEPSGKFHFCMAGFVLKNTLSDYGGVTRGICDVDGKGALISIKETKHVVRCGDGAGVETEDGGLVPLDPDSLVSMNFWGFTPDFLDELERGFGEFLEGLGEDALTAEYLLPTIVDGLLARQRVELTVLPSPDRWFGVTYKEDVPFVRREMERLVEQGFYPAKL